MPRLNRWKNDGNSCGIMGLCVNAHGAEKRIKVRNNRDNNRDNRRDNKRKKKMN